MFAGKFKLEIFAQFLLFRLSLRESKDLVKLLLADGLNIVLECRKKQFSNYADSLF